MESSSSIGSTFFHSWFTCFCYTLSVKLFGKCFLVHREWHWQNCSSFLPSAARELPWLVHPEAFSRFQAHIFVVVNNLSLPFTVNWFSSLLTVFSITVFFGVVSMDNIKNCFSFHFLCLHQDRNAWQFRHPDAQRDGLLHGDGGHPAVSGGLWFNVVSLFCSPKISSLEGWWSWREAPLTLLQDELPARRHGEYSHGESELTRFCARRPLHQPYAAHGQDRVLWRKGEEGHIWCQEDFLFVCHLWPLICNITVDNRVKCKWVLFLFSVTLYELFPETKLFLTFLIISVSLSWIPSFFEIRHSWSSPVDLNFPCFLLLLFKTNLVSLKCILLLWKLNSWRFIL